MTTKGMFAVCASAVVLLWSGMAGALEPAEKCQALKNKDTGKLASCLQKAEMKLVKTAGTCSGGGEDCYRDDDCAGVETCDKNLTKYNDATKKCAEKFLGKWAKDETKGEGQCPDGGMDPNSMLDFVTEHSEDVAIALAGGGLPAFEEDYLACQADLAAAELCGNGVADPNEDCDLGDMGIGTCVTEGFLGGTLACVGGCAYDTSGCVDAKRVFVTSTMMTGDFGGLAAADTECGNRATAAGLGGTWKAWLSDGATEGKDRVLDTAYYLIDGTTKVVDNKTDLLDGSIDNKINKDENGDPSTAEVWTGTRDTGSRYTNRCNDWTSTSGGGLTGSADYTSVSWTSFGDQNCSGSHGLFCFEQ